jgi:AraC-like DNA-binding protein
MNGYINKDSLIFEYQKRIAELITENDYLAQMALFQKYGYIIIGVLLICVIILIVFLYQDISNTKKKNAIIADNINNRSIKGSLDDLCVLRESIKNELLSSKDFINSTFDKETFAIEKRITLSELNKILVELRLDYSLELLRDRKSKLTMEEIAFRSGLNNARNLQRHFKMNFGITPKEFRSNC